MGWSELRVGCKDNHAKSTSARVLHARSAGFPRGEPRAGRAARNLKAIVTKIRSRSRKPGAVSEKRSLGQRREMERAPRCPRRQPRQVRQRARVLWALGRFSTGQSARGPRGSEFGKFGYVLPKPRPPNWRGVGVEKSRPMEWVVARLALAAKTTPPSPPARACSISGRLVLHGAKRAQAA